MCAVPSTFQKSVFCIKIFSFLRSLEDNASAHHLEVPVDPFGRMLESSYSSQVLL